MPARPCNIRILQDTDRNYRGVRGHLPRQTAAHVERSLNVARAAASAGRCSEMHRHTQDARAVLDQLLDMLLGRR